MFALVVLLAVFAAMFYAIFLAPVDNPMLDPEVARRHRERIAERDSAPPPPKKSVRCPGGPAWPSRSACVALAMFAGERA